MAKEFSLLIDKACSMDGLTVGAVVQGSGEMGVVDLTIVAARASGGGVKDEGHFLHVRATRTNWFDDAHPIKRIQYGPHLTRCDVTQCTVLKP